MNELIEITAERREAIRRAHAALVRLAIDPEASEPARRQVAIVNAPGCFDDWAAWESVVVLEHMVYSRGLVTAEEVDRERRAYAAADPIDRPCDECGAEPGEECRPDCTGPDSQHCSADA